MREDIPTTDKHKIAVIGFADGHRDDAPWDDPDMEFWGLNRLHAVLPTRTFHRWFEIHSLKKYYEGDDLHRKFLRNFAGPVYLRPQDVGEFDIPNQEPLPIGTLEEVFPDYWTNSVSYMLALAILMLQPHAEKHQAGEGPQPELHIYGVDMAQDSLLQAEYSEQRPSCEFMLGFASAAGIQLFLPEGTDLLKTSHRYGLDESDPIRGKWINRHRELANRKAQIQAQIEQGDKQRTQLVAGINQLDGAMQEIQYQMRNLTPPPEPRAPSEDEVESVTLEQVAGGLSFVQQQLAELRAAFEQPSNEGT